MQIEHLLVNLEEVRLGRMSAGQFKSMDMPTNVPTPWHVHHEIESVSVPALYRV